MLYKVIIEAISKTMEQQPEGRLDEDFFYQAVDIIHFLKQQDIPAEYQKMLQGFISRVNQEAMFYVAPMFVKMYNTEKMGSPSEKKINLMLEAMTVSQRRQAYEETIKLLGASSHQPLAAFHRMKIKEIFKTEE